VKTLDALLTEQKRSRIDAVAELGAAAIAPASVDSRVTPRNARDPGNRYDPAHPDRDPRDVTTLHAEVVKPEDLPEPSPEQQRILDTLSVYDGARFRQQFGLRPLPVQL
jgi:hypothetical protein